MGQPIHLEAAPRRRRIGALLAAPRPSADDLIQRWVEEQARYRP